MRLNQVYCLLFNICGFSFAAIAMDRPNTASIESVDNSEEIFRDVLSEMKILVEAPCVKQYFPFMLTKLELLKPKIDKSLRAMSAFALSSDALVEDLGFLLKMTNNVRNLLTDCMVEMASNGVGGNWVENIPGKYQEYHLKEWINLLSGELNNCFYFYQSYTKEAQMKKV